MGEVRKSLLAITQIQGLSWEAGSESRNTDFASIRGPSATESVVLLLSRQASPFLTISAHIGKRIPELKKSVDFFSSIVKELEDLRKRLVLNLKDTARYFFQPESREWHLIEQAEEFTNEIVEMYSTELQVRLTIIHEMSTKPLKPSVYSLLMTIWAAEPYLEHGRLEDILEEIVCLEETLNSKLHEISTTTTNVMQ